MAEQLQARPAEEAPRHEKELLIQANERLADDTMGMLRIQDRLRAEFFPEEMRERLEQWSLDNGADRIVRQLEFRHQYRPGPDGDLDLLNRIFDASEADTNELKRIYRDYFPDVFPEVAI